MAAPTTSSSKSCGRASRASTTACNAVFGCSSPGTAAATGPDTRARFSATNPANATSTARTGPPPR